MSQDTDTRLLAAELEASIARGTPDEPQWWSRASTLAFEHRTTEPYQVWLALERLGVGR